LGILYCPTRRQTAVYPWQTVFGSTIVNAGTPTMVGRNDYAANGGETYTSPGYPTSVVAWTPLPNKESGPLSVAQVEDSIGQETSNARITFGNIASYATGIVYTGSLIKMSDIVDGTSNTYLAGEKYVCPDYYATGMDYGDNEAALVGDNEDNARWTLAGTNSVAVVPQPDTPGLYSRWLFGSAHANGFHMAFCDGSVQFINYSIDLETHRCLGNRKDGKTIDGKKF